MSVPKTTKTNFPEEKYKQYKLRVDAHNEPFTFDQIKKILILAINDFENGSISSDQLSSIGNSLFFQLVKHKEPQKDSELFGAVLAASELSFYIRKPSLLGQFNIFLKEVLEFKNNYAEILVGISNRS